MDIQDTMLIKNVQYLVPVMAYFNPKLNAASKVLTLDDDEYQGLISLSCTDI